MKFSIFNFATLILSIPSFVGVGMLVAIHVNYHLAYYSIYQDNLDLSFSVGIVTGILAFVIEQMKPITIPWVKWPCFICNFTWIIISFLGLLSRGPIT